jgi:cytochrome c2
MPLAFLMAMLLPASAGTARAADDDVAAGERLYIAQCKICHGSVHPDAALPSQQRFALSGTQTQVTDAPPIVDRVAFAPPFGPHLRGVFGRPAGSVEGFDYSKALLTNLKGMEWNEASLDVWITGPQLWVPGVYMFYKQPDAEVRRKIIAYLKANRE